MKKQFVIIVAGGYGMRMGSSTPKQFLNLNGTPVLMHTISKHYEYNPTIEIILVLPNEHFSTWESLCENYNFKIKHEIVTGGETRYQSVKNGLAHVTSLGLVAVHDGVRPLVSADLIARCYNEAELRGNAIPSVEINETVREIVLNGNKQLNRTNIKLIQTPQVFKSEILKKAYELPFSDEFTDDASVIEKAGYKINLVNGEKQNIKITTELDLKIAECILKNK